MMGYEHPPETVWKAQELYCVDRLSFDRTAEVTGVAASTLKRWSERYGWREKREEIALAESDIRINTIRGRRAVLERLIQAQDGKEASQVAFAVASLESLALKQQELIMAGKISGVTDPETRPRIATRADAAGALRQAVENKLGLALADPRNITADSVKDIIRCLDLLADLEAGLPSEDAPEETAKRGLSGDVARKLYAALGIEEE